MSSRLHPSFQGAGSADRRSQLAVSTSFTYAELETMEEKFSRQLHGKPELSRDDFAECISHMGVTDKTHHDAYFKIFDRDGSGSISFRELVTGLSTLLRGSTDAQIELDFKVWADSNGLIGRSEFVEYYRTSMFTGSSGDSMPDVVLQKLAEDTFDEVRDVNSFQSCFTSLFPLFPFVSRWIATTVGPST